MLFHISLSLALLIKLKHTLINVRNIIFQIGHILKVKSGSHKKSVYVELLKIEVAGGKMCLLGFV